MAKKNCIDKKLYEIDYPFEVKNEMENFSFMPDGKTPLIMASKEELIKVIYALGVAYAQKNQNIQN